MPPVAQAALSSSMKELMERGALEQMQMLYQSLHAYLGSQHALPPPLAAFTPTPSPPSRRSKEQRTSHSPRRGGAPRPRPLTVLRKPPSPKRGETSRASPRLDTHRRLHGSSALLPAQEVAAFKRTMRRSRPRFMVGEGQREEARHFPRPGQGVAQPAPLPDIGPALPPPPAVIPRRPDTRAIGPEPVVRRTTTRPKASPRAPREPRWDRKATPSLRWARHTDKGKGKRMGD